MRPALIKKAKSGNSQCKGMGNENEKKRVKGQSVITLLNGQTIKQSNTVN
jgi:hypothetical protein